MKGIVLRLLAALSLAALLAGCASTPAVRDTAQGNVLPPPDTTTTSGAYTGGSDYRIGAQDLLSITVFGVKDLDRDVRVNSNGKISLPLIGAVQAGGQTIPALEHAIEAELAKSYMQNPQVSVFVKEYTSQRITVDGSVNKPGIYPVTGRTTLIQAIAESGGLAPLAKRSEVVVFRTVGGKKMLAVFDMEKITTGQAPDPEVYGDDVVVVQQSGSRNALQNLIKLAPVIGLFILY